MQKRSRSKNSTTPKERLVAEAKGASRRSPQATTGVSGGTACCGKPGRTTPQPI
jgi:hypothetical protein